MCKDASRPPPIRRHRLLWMRLDRTITVVVVKNDCFRYYHKRKYHGKRNAKPNLCNVFRKFYVHFHDQTGSRNVAVRLERKRFVPPRSAAATVVEQSVHAYAFFFTEMSRMPFSTTRIRHRVWKYIMSLPERERTRTRCVVGY